MHKQEMTDKTTKFRQDVGARLRRLREHLKLRQEDLGEIIGMVGSGIANIEKGIRGLDPEDALRLKQSKGVTLDWLYGNDPSGLPNTLHKPLTAPKAVPATSKKSDKRGTA